jgi:hypothetical protein
MTIERDRRMHLGCIRAVAYNRVIDRVTSENHTHIPYVATSQITGARCLECGRPTHYVFIIHVLS